MNICKDRAFEVLTRLSVPRIAGTPGELAAAELLKAECEKIGVPYVRLHDIDKECGHPTELGMRQIADQVGEVLRGL